MSFIKRKFILRFYTTTKALPNIKQVKFLNKKKFTKAALNKNFKSFVIYIIALEILPASTITIHLLEIV